MDAARQTHDAQRQQAPEKPVAETKPQAAPTRRGPAAAQGAQFAGGQRAGQQRGASGAQGGQFAAQQQGAAGLGARKDVPSGYRALVDVAAGEGGTWRVAMPLDASFGAKVRPGKQTAEIHFEPGILIMGPSNLPDLAIERVVVDLEQMSVADLKASMPGASSGGAAIGQFETQLASEIVRTYLMSPLSVNEAVGTLDPGHEGGLIGSILDQMAPGWGEASKQGGKKGKPRRFDLGSVAIEIDDSSVVSAGIDTKRDSVYIHLDNVRVFALNDVVEMSGVRIDFRLPDHRLTINLKSAEINTGLGDLGVIDDKSLSYSLDEPQRAEKTVWDYLIWGPLATSKYAADKASEAIDNKIRQAGRDLVMSYFPPALESRSAAELYQKSMGFAGKKAGRNANDPNEALMTVDATAASSESDGPTSGAPLVDLDARGDTTERARQVLYSFPLTGEAQFLGQALGGGTLEIAVDEGANLDFVRTPTSVRMQATGGREGRQAALFLHLDSQPWMDDYSIQRLEYDHQTGELDIDASPRFGEYTEKLLGAIIHHAVLPGSMTPELEAVHNAIGTRKSEADQNGREVLARLEVAQIGEVFALIEAGQNLSVSYEDNSGKASGGHDLVRISAGGAGLQIVTPGADFIPTLTLTEITYDVRTSDVTISGDESADIGASVEGLLGSVVEGLLPLLPGGSALTREHEDQAAIDRRRAEGSQGVSLPADGTVLYQQDMGELGTIAVVTAPGYNIKVVQDNDGVHVDTGAADGVSDLRIFVTGARLQAGLHDVRMDGQGTIDYDLRSATYDPTGFDWATPLERGAAEAGKQTWGEQLLTGVADHFAGDAIRQYMPKPAEAGATERILASVEAEGMSVDVVIGKDDAITAGIEGDSGGQRLVVDAGAGLTWRATGGPVAALPATRVQRIELDLTTGELTIESNPDIGPITETIATKFLHHMIRQPGLIPAEARETIESLGFGGLLAAAETVEQVAPARATLLWEGTVPQAGRVDVSVDSLSGLDLSVSGALATLTMPGKGLLARIPELGFAFDMKRVVYNIHEASLVSVESSPELGAYEKTLISAAALHFMPAVIRAQLDPAGAQAAPSEQTYTVQSGDTLGRIASRFDVPGGYMAIARANGIADPNRIAVGQVLTIPGSAAPAPAPTSGAAAQLGGEQDGRYVHFTYNSSYGPVQICSDAGSAISVGIREVPRKSRGGQPAQAIVVEATGGRGIFIKTTQGGQLARFDGDGLSRFAYFLHSGDVEMETLVGGQPGEVGTLVERVLEASMMTFVAPHVPAEMRGTLGIVTAEEAVDGPDLGGGVPRGFIPLGIEMPTGGGLGNLQVYVHPDEAIALSATGGRTTLSTRHGLYFKIDGFPTVPRFGYITWDRRTQTIEADGLGRGTEGILEQAVHTFVDVYLRSQGHDPGVRTLHSTLSQRPSRVSGAFPLFEGDHYGLYLEPGYSLTMQVTGGRIDFIADGLFVDGAKIARYDLSGFSYDFNTQKAELDLDSRGILSWLLKPLVKLGISIAGQVASGEAGITGVMHAILPEKVKRRGYNLFADRDLSGTFEQLMAKFESDEPSDMDVGGLVNDLQDFDAKAANLQPVMQRVQELKRSRQNRTLRKELERVLELVAKVDKGKRARLKLGRTRYTISAYEVDSQFVIFYLQGRDMPVSFDTHDARWYSGARRADVRSGR